jgi:hypothetical protein
MLVPHCDSSEPTPGVFRGRVGKIGAEVKEGLKRNGAGAAIKLFR